MSQTVYLILVTQSQAVASQINELINQSPTLSYHLERAFNAANLNHLLHNQKWDLILLDGGNHQFAECAMVLSQHPNGVDTPLVLLTSKAFPQKPQMVKNARVLDLDVLSGEALQSVVQSTIDVGSVHLTPVVPNYEARPTAVWQEVSIVEFFKACVAQVETMADDQNVTTFVTYGEGLHNMVVDREQLLIVTKTLLLNALEQTSEDGSIGLEVIGDRQHETLHITIWDTGNGLMNETLLHSAKLGDVSEMSKAVAAVYEQEGTISVRGILGRGSNITVSIPWLVGVPTKSEKEISSQLPIKKILIVEDNRITAETMTSYLIYNRFDVCHTMNGQQALNQITTFRPDLVLMDIHMPVMDGLEATRRIRAHEDTMIAQTPIIALTALSMSSDRKDCFDAGVDDYISKPVSLRWLVQAIRMRLYKTPYSI